MLMGVGGNCNDKKASDGFLMVLYIVIGSSLNNI